MADEILGISAHFDANDMLQTFDMLTKRLDKLGIDTTNLQNKLMVRGTKSQQAQTRIVRKRKKHLR